MSESSGATDLCSRRGEMAIGFVPECMGVYLFSFRVVLSHYLSEKIQVEAS